MICALIAAAARAATSVTIDAARALPSATAGLDPASAPTSHRFRRRFLPLSVPLLLSALCDGAFPCAALVVVALEASAWAWASLWRNIL
jgi:hypothetical protein